MGSWGFLSTNLVYWLVQDSTIDQRFIHRYPSLSLFRDLYHLHLAQIVSGIYYHNQKYLLLHNIHFPLSGSTQQWNVTALPGTRSLPFSFINHTEISIILLIWNQNTLFIPWYGNVSLGFSGMLCIIWHFSQRSGTPQNKGPHTWKFEYNEVWSGGNAR